MLTRPFPRVQPRASALWANRTVLVAVAGLQGGSFPGYRQGSRTSFKIFVNHIIVNSGQGSPNAITL